MLSFSLIEFTRIAGIVIIYIWQVKCVTDNIFVEDTPKTLLESLNGGWLQIKPLFHSRYAYRLLLIGAIQFGATVG